MAVTLPEKYPGLERACLHDESAKEMLRVDAAVEANGVKTGDEVYLDFWAYKTLKPGEREAERYIERNTHSSIFICVDNGRVIFINTKAEFAKALSEAQRDRIPEERRAAHYRGSQYRGGVDCERVADIRKV